MAAHRRAAGGNGPGVSPLNGRMVAVVFRLLRHARRAWRLTGGRLVETALEFRP